MRLMILANEFLKEELLNNGITQEIDLVWVREAAGFFQHDTADGFIDLLFEDRSQRIELLKSLLPRPVIVNAVETTLKKINAPFVRINAWRGFLKRSVIEASCDDEKIKRQAEKIFSFFNKRMEWIPDQPGFVTPRIIAMIINEAYFALEEKISTKDEIDTAMKLGTNYPYGPFEWSNNIGVKNICSLLNELSKTNTRYQPAPSLEKETMI